MASITDIGGLLDASAKAEEIVADMRRASDRTEVGLREIGSSGGVFSNQRIPIVSAGHDTFIHELIARAGGR
jgi:ABC-type Fe3+-hydroxamate transport system substrate-binding protein